MAKAPLALVKEKFGDKAKLVEAVKAFAADGGLWLAHANHETLEHVSNSKLLKLHATFTAVKSEFGSREKLVEAIDVASRVGSRKVITFTGMRFPDMDEERAAAECVAAWQRVLPLAEARGVTLVLEHLNTRDATHPMKGHPGYFGDDVDFCVDLVRRVGSPNFKLLFDVYHVSIMNGDVIRRIDALRDLIGHVHTAGTPGRGELDDTQETNYPAVMRAVAAAGYDDFVAHEFIPTWDDPVLALRHAAMVCDV